MDSSEHFSHKARENTTQKINAGTPCHSEIYDVVTLISWCLGLAFPSLRLHEMPSEDLVIFVFALIIVIFGVTFFSPEVNCPIVSLKH